VIELKLTLEDVEYLLELLDKEVFVNLNLLAEPLYEEIHLQTYL